jgi:2',3'-cyclic-nucleotide 2'-phosphodiesterase (5'-nucleotidase family)
MHYDLSTIENHDFDNGVLTVCSNTRQFEFVSANYDFKIQSWIG